MLRLVGSASRAAAASAPSTPRVFSQNVRGISAAAKKIGHYTDPTRGKAAQDKLLFTPGPLTTSWSTRKAATRDLGSRDKEFIEVIKSVRSGLLEVAGVSPSEYTAVPMQGSGTYGVESVISSVVPRGKKLLVVANGAYGLRMTLMAKAQDIPFTLVECPDDTWPSLTEIEAILKNDNGAHSHVSMVHSETTSGIINPVTEVGQLVKRYNRGYIVDAMSSFGAYNIDFKAGNIDFLVSSANKCLEGIPGFSFAIGRKSAVAAAKGNARALCLDLEAQCTGLDTSSQFRFTPPTHAMLAFAQALAEHKLEGGVEGRAARYKLNQQTLQDRMPKLGFHLYLPESKQGHIISSYHYPKDPNFNFETFYSKLNEQGCVIYPGKVSKADCFRIGHIGRLFVEDTKFLLKAIEKTCKEMKTAAFHKDEKPARKAAAKNK